MAAAAVVPCRGGQREGGETGRKEGGRSRGSATHRDGGRTGTEEAPAGRRRGRGRSRAARLPGGGGGGQPRVLAGGVGPTWASTGFKGPRAGWSGPTAGKALEGDVRDSAAREPNPCATLPRPFPHFPLTIQPPQEIWISLEELETTAIRRSVLSPNAAEGEVRTRLPSPEQPQFTSSPPPFEGAPPPSNTSTTSATIRRTHPAPHLHPGATGEPPPPMPDPPLPLPLLLIVRSATRAIVRSVTF
ncbi:proline-rich receptor-like protein kinase PERK10 [Triticum aestivum]|uniref:proline-rich receptor-like protein kinase PERK10 n=1 Tax=Triticum aestivum TaxID=4565 RepID=UPI001D024205|nr:proline-rich receptor-like protein kinase PERK10 [Triticum aestivum]